jgi:dolichol-phosphate mannosyltransferase
LNDHQPQNAKLHTPQMLIERRSAPQLAVIIPTFNESQNIEPLIKRIQSALVGLRWEVVFVDDDSPDGTAYIVKKLALRNPSIRCIHRIGRRGLSRAVIEGIQATSADFIFVMDGDGQHDETRLQAMYLELSENAADIVVGTRYADGGGIGNWDSKRAWMSAFATKLSATVMRDHKVSDPMSGFFGIQRQVFDKVVRKLSGEGYKILVDIFASYPGTLKVAEVPYTFRERSFGQSKLDSAVVLEYLLLLLEKRLPGIVPPRLILFAAVGASGLLIHMVVLAVMYKQWQFDFGVSQAVATLVAMTTNFFVNNALTYRDRRLKGVRIVLGLASFYLVCGLGAVANVGVARAVFEQPTTWWLASIAGVLVGTVWNFAMSNLVTWGTKKP